MWKPPNQAAVYSVCTPGLWRSGSSMQRQAGQRRLQRKAEQTALTRARMAHSRPSFMAASSWEPVTSA